MTVNQNLNHIVKRQKWIIANPEADCSNQIIFDLKRLENMATKFPHFRAEHVAICIRNYNKLLA